MLNRFKPSSKIFLPTVPSLYFFVDHSCYFCLVFVMLLYARLFIVALRSTAWKGLTSSLSFVMPNCEFVTYSLVSWFRCGH